MENDEWWQTGAHMQEFSDGFYSDYKEEIAANRMDPLNHSFMGAV